MFGGRRFDAVPPRIFAAAVATVVVLAVLGLNQLRSDDTAPSSDAAASAAQVLDGVEISTTLPPIEIQPGWVAKGYSRYGDNGSGSDPVPIATVPGAIEEGVPATTAPPRVKIPKDAPASTAAAPRPTQAPRPATPQPTQPAATQPPPKPPAPTSPPPTQPPPTQPPPTTVAPTTVAPTTVAPT